VTYELAKKLKDAGFPQRELTVGNHIDKYYEPTLSELIKACGDDFDLLREPFGNPEDNHFDVFYRAFSKRSDLWSPIYVDVQGEGSTPEEAVAKLWLALQVSD